MRDAGGADAGEGRTGTAGIAGAPASQALWEIHWGLNAITNTVSQERETSTNPALMVVPFFVIRN